MATLGSEIEGVGRNQAARRHRELGVARETPTVGPLRVSLHARPLSQCQAP